MFYSMYIMYLCLCTFTGIIICKCPGTTMQGDVVIMSKFDSGNVRQLTNIYSLSLSSKLTLSHA